MTERLTGYVRETKEKKEEEEGEAAGSNRKGNRGREDLAEEQK